MQANNLGYMKSILWISVLLLCVSFSFFTYELWFNNDLTMLLESNKKIDSSLIKTNQKLKSLTNLLVEQNTLQSKKIEMLQDQIDNLKKLKIKKNKQNKTLNLLKMIGLTPTN